MADKEMTPLEFLNAFRDYCGKQEPEGRYSPGDAQGCAMAQFLKSVYANGLLLSPVEYSIDGKTWLHYPQICYVAAVNAIDSGGSSTWGALHERLIAFSALFTKALRNYDSYSPKLETTVSGLINDMMNP